MLPRVGESENIDPRPTISTLRNSHFYVTIRGMNLEKNSPTPISLQGVVNEKLEELRLKTIETANNLGKGAYFERAFERARQDVERCELMRKSIEEVRGLRKESWRESIRDTLPGFASSCQENARKGFIAIGISEEDSKHLASYMFSAFIPQKSDL